jgi:hypothetical protein
MDADDALNLHEWTSCEVHGHDFQGEGAARKCGDCGELSNSD